MEYSDYIRVNLELTRFIYINIDRFHDTCFGKQITGQYDV